MNKQKEFCRKIMMSDTMATLMVTLNQGEYLQSAKVPWYEKLMTKEEIIDISKTW